MKALLKVAVFAIVCSHASAVYKVGDTPKNYCWKDQNDKTVCMEDAEYAGKVKVLLYNTGWCGPCNSEFQELPGATNKFKGKNVVFFSLSAAGWSSSSAPDKKFLAEWIKKHKLDKAEAAYVIAGSPRDAGKDFHEDVYIPNVAIVDTMGQVAYKAINPGADKISDEVEALLPMPVPTKN